MQVLCTGFCKPFSRTEITVNTRTADIKVLGEYVPGHLNTLNLNRLKEFAAIPYHIEWYRGPDSRKVFPLFQLALTLFNLLLGFALPTSLRVAGIGTVELRHPFGSFVGRQSHRPRSSCRRRSQRPCVGRCGWDRTTRGVPRRRCPTGCLGPGTDPLRSRPTRC